MKKKNKHFYHKLVNIDALFVKLEEQDFTEEERDVLVEVAERTLHHSILDLVLSELSDKDKHLFLKHHAEENHKEVWTLLTEKVDNIEEKIKQTAEQVSQRLHKDLKR